MSNTKLSRSCALNILSLTACSLAFRYLKCFSFYLRRFGFVSLPNSIHTIGEKNDDVDLDLLERMGSLGVSDECQVTCTLPTMESRIVFEEENVLPSDVESSRPSMENHASTRDLMCHLHGMSPVRKRGAPLRLSIQSISSIGTGCKHVSASPFPTPSMGSAGLNSQSKLLSFDFVET